MINLYPIKKPEYSIVILCYQAGKFIKTYIKEVIENVNSLKVDYEIVLVANYWENSNDDTPTIAKELSKKNPTIKVVALPKKGMMGWDLISGFKECTGKFIAVIDGDGQMPSFDLIRVYRKIKEENLDFVKTYRQKREDQFYRVIISLVYNFVFRFLFPGLALRDVNSKPKIITREAYQKLNLNSFDWFIDAEIMIQIRRLRLKVGEIPTVFNKIDTRPSYVKFYAIWEFAKNLIKARIHEFKSEKVRK